MSLKLITPPAAEPVVLAEVKPHLRLELDYIAEDVLLTALITTAREYCEGFQKRAYLSQTWERILDGFPSRDVIDLPLPPLQSVTSVKYISSDGAETPMVAGTDYIADADVEPGRIFLPYGVSWPSFTPYPYGAVRIQFVAGHATAARVPARVKQAILLTIGDLYGNRENTTIGKQGYELPVGAKALLWQDRVMLV